MPDCWTTLPRAYQYANTTAGNSSKYKTMLCVRAVLGNVQYLTREDHNREAPDRNYDSVFSLCFEPVDTYALTRDLQVETRVPNEPREVIVYNSEAVRPAFLILCK